jgi:hypothetical protein
MKKLLMLVVAIVMMLSLFPVGCSGGTPKPPVSKLIDLDKLVTDNMTLDEVYVLLKPELKQTGTLYQAEIIENTAGGWKIDTKDGGYAEGEEGPYQALFFKPVKSGAQSYMVVFRAKAVVGKAWFSGTNAFYIEKYLKGEGVFHVNE